MARDALTISSKVLEHLRRAGVDLPAPPSELSTAEYFAFWRDIAACDAPPDLGVKLGMAVFGQSLAAQAALHAATLGARCARTPERVPILGTYDAAALASRPQLKGLPCLLSIRSPRDSARIPQRAKSSPTSASMARPRS